MAPEQLDANEHKPRLERFGHWMLSKLRKANHALVMLLLGNITELIPANHFLDALICGASAGKQGPRSQKRWIFGKWAAF